jgi:hypothetical protein
VPFGLRGLRMSHRRVVLRHRASLWVVVKVAGMRIVLANVVLLLLLLWLACTAVMALRPGGSGRARRAERRRGTVEREAPTAGVTELMEG